MLSQGFRSRSARREEIGKGKRYSRIGSEQEKKRNGNDNSSGEDDITQKYAEIENATEGQIREVSVLLLLVLPKYSCTTTNFPNFFCTRINILKFFLVPCAGFFEGFCYLSAICFRINFQI